MKINEYQEASTLWLEHKDALHNYILKRTKDADVANELSHEILMKVYKSCCSDREIKNTRSWIFQIAHNITIDFFKKQKKISHDLPELFVEDDTTVYQDAAACIEPLIRLLPEEYAKPLLLADLEGMKQSKVAEKLNISLTATKSRIQRARKMLKEEFMNCCHIETDDKGNLVSFGISNSCDALQNYCNKTDEK